MAIGNLVSKSKDKQLRARNGYIYIDIYLHILFSMFKEGLSTAR